MPRAEAVVRPVMIDRAAPQPLFREQALAEQTQALRGTTVARLGPGPRALTALVVLAALAVVAFACWGHYTRNEHVAGTLEPSRGLVTVRTPQAGIVAERRVGEGDRVRRGDVLFVLSSDRAAMHAREAQAEVVEQLERRSESLVREREAQARIDGLAIQTLEARQRGLQAEAGRVRTELQLQAERVELARAQVARHRELVAAHFETAAALQPHQTAELEQRARQVQIERSLAELERDRQAVAFELDAARLRRSNAASGIDRLRAELAQQRTEAELRRQVVVTAPTDGQVTALTVDVGHAADAAAPLLLLLPQDAELQAKLWLPSRAIGFVRLRQPVRLRYQAYPHQHYGQQEGQVVEISRAPLEPAAAATAGAPKEGGEALYRVIVRLPAQQLRAHGGDLALQAGMALDADIRLDTRRLIDWLLDPLRPPQSPQSPQSSQSPPPRHSAQSQPQQSPRSPQAPQAPQG
jgi:membrane fusion protein